MPRIILRTAKQRRGGHGSPAKGKSANRLVPLTDPHFVDELRRLFASTKEQFEIDTQTGERTPLLIWQTTDRTVRNWLTKAERADGPRKRGKHGSVYPGVCTRYRGQPPGAVHSADAGCDHDDTGA